MKEKILSKIVLIVLVLSFILSFYEVKAYTGEIDPEDYITLPANMTISDGIAKGTISLSSNATGYNIAYQKVNIEESTYNNFIEKNNEIKDYVANVEKVLKEKKEEIDKIEEEGKALLLSDPQNIDALKEVYSRYTTASDEYEQYVETENANIEKKEKELYAILPDYTDNWTETTNTSDNVQINVSEYAPGEKIFFTLWVKISNGSNTYYDFKIYSTQINSNSNNIEVEPGDFSKAKFALVKEGISNAVVEISNVKPKEGSSYYLFISNNNQKPNITGDINNYNDKINIEYNKDTNKFITVGDEVRRNVELNQELYATVVESNSEGNLNVISYGNKLDRFEEPKYSDAFYETFVSSDTDQIVTNFTHAQANNRKIQIKIGKITDNSILQKIKNKDASGFSSLLNYAKSNSAIYNETTDAVKDDWYAIEYKTEETVGSTKSKLINLTGLQNNEYYYLYVKTDDENGKYISNEAVTLAQANVYDDRWSMYFYGSEDFKWADFGNIDDTVASGKIPQTGANTLGFAVCGALIISIGAFSYISYKKNKF